MNARKRKRFIHCTVVLLVLGVVLGMAGCSKKALKTASPDAMAADTKPAAVEAGSSAALGGVTESGGIVDDEGKIGELEIEILGSDFDDSGQLVPGRSGAASSPGKDETIVILPRPKDEGPSSSEEAESPEHVPEPLIVAEVQRELLVPLPARETEPRAPSVASVATDTFFIKEDFEDIYFDFDRWAIPKPMQARLSDHAQWLKAHPGSDVFIEGHCDVRGSREYNMVLGEKRARSVKDFLIDLGVKEDQLFMISYGKERLTCFETQESCHQGNRRAHLLLR